MNTVSSLHFHSQGPAALSGSGPQGIIACMICLATYAPSRGYQHLAQAPGVVSESAFMSMCHFCFRCRRPACPMCWDEVNGICGSCVQETQLTFRTEPPSLAGVVLPPNPLPKTQIGREQRGMPPFVCVQPGRFQKPDAAPISASHAIAAIPSFDTEPVQSAVQQEHTPKQQAPIIQRQERPGVWEIATKPVPHLAAVAESRDVEEEDEPESEPVGAIARIGQMIERTLTFVVLIILITIVVLVVAALISLQANSIITTILNVDIRAEIAYLLQLIQQLH